MVRITKQKLKDYLAKNYDVNEDQVQEDLQIPSEQTDQIKSWLRELEAEQWIRSTYCIVHRMTEYDPGQAQDSASRQEEPEVESPISVKLFTPMSRHGEIELLYNDDTNFSRTKAYLDTLIQQALNRFELSEQDYNQLRRDLLDDVSIAAKRFLASKRDTETHYKFSTYFTWYISERINKVPNLKRKEGV